MKAEIAYYFDKWLKDFSSKKLLTYTKLKGIYEYETGKKLIEF
jgi:hypothetical protein